jgi:glycosyltransferase involved in cell wall biosynthesis
LELAKIMKIGQVFNDFLLPGGEAQVYSQIGAKLQTSSFYRTSKEWAGLEGLQRVGPLLKSFHNATVLREFREWVSIEKPEGLIFHNIFPVLSPSIALETKRLNIPSILFLHSYRYLCVNGLFLNHGEPCERCLHGNFWPAAATACWRESHALSAWYGAILSTLRPRGFFQNFHRLIAVSHFVKTKYVEAGIEPERIEVLPHFFDFEAFRPSYEDQGYVLFIGRLSPEKGLLTLLNAARLLPNIPFRIAGDGPELEKTKDFLALNSMSNVQLVGHVSGELKHSLLAGARFVVVPSEAQETYGLVIAEAYSAGKAVLASRIGGLTEIITEVTGHLFEPKNVEQLRARIHDMFENQKRTRDWGREGRWWIETHARFEDWKIRLMNIFRSASIEM